MAQQTAVNFLINYMCANFHLTDESLQKFEQAKAMEKDQIKNAYWNGTTDMDKADALLMAEDFYNEYYSK